MSEIIENKSQFVEGLVSYFLYIYELIMRSLSFLVICGFSINHLFKLVLLSTYFYERYTSALKLDLNMPIYLVDGLERGLKDVRIVNSSANSVICVSYHAACIYLSKVLA